MNQLDNKHWYFYRTDPTPWIRFEEDHHKLRGDHAFIWFVAALMIVVGVVVL